mgnify:CR=1 FL=1
MKRKIFAILAFLLCVTSVHAAVGQAMIDGVNYALSTDGEVRTATVVAGDKKYAGHVVIPSVVTFAGDQYKVTAVGNEAFKECDGLQSITFGENVTTIGDRAFSACTQLTEVVLPQGLTSIGDFAFIYCSGLKTIDIPNSVTNLGVCCFSLCITATSLKIGSGVSTIPLNAFESCYVLTSVVIPKNVNLIKNYAFADCRKLASVTILSDAISITGSDVFRDCSALDSLVFGESVNTIRSSSFNLGNRTNVISLAMFPPVCEGDTSPFAGVSPYCVLYVPKGCAADYRVAKGWSGQFRAVREMTDSDHSANCDVNGDGVVDIADATAVIECILAK